MLPLVAASPAEKRKFVRSLERLLRKQFGLPQKELRDDPLDVLIQTILSQNTSDINSRRAYQNLRDQFPTWASVLAAATTAVEDAIRNGGLAKIKAARIQSILRSIHKECHETSLRFLCQMDAHEVAAFLCEFPGVGPKTACCVLLFGCGMDVFPVDTHILRISKRLGLLEESVSLERAHQLWSQFIPPGLAHSLHINLIEHGRSVCRARNPLCSSCLLKEHCAFFQKILR
jgi:endonuclease-3